ncbi:MAG: hypothetical protein IIA98_08740 [Proteobacteria bacterium]|nr:hypothetical protein [Pseudomonadota bacterium]
MIDSELPMIYLSAPSITDWIVAIASAVGALGIVLVAFQLLVMWKQVKADHERSRRQGAINAVRYWSSTLSPVTAAAERLVGSFSEVDCRRLANFDSICVSKDQYPLLEACLEELIDVESLTADNFDLSKKQVVRLRSLVISYLNQTEATLIEWQLATADRKILEAQFDFLLDEQRGESVYWLIFERLLAFTTFPQSMRSWPSLR